MLPNTDLIGGTYLAQQIVHSTVSLKIAHINSLIFEFVTVSAGGNGSADV
ncbi:hypothetical protein GCM10009347_42310 [Shewanella algicola]|nr:hypothetical protein GCM10009347_42310 [Shewanella algicola]